MLTNSFIVLEAHNLICVNKPQSLLVVHKHGGFYGCHGDGKLYGNFHTFMKRKSKETKPICD